MNINPHFGGVYPFYQLTQSQAADIAEIAFRFKKEDEEHQITVLGTGERKNKGTNLTVVISEALNLRLEEALKEIGIPQVSNKGSSLNEPLVKRYSGSSMKPVTGVNLPDSREAKKSPGIHISYSI